MPTDRPCLRFLFDKKYRINLSTRETREMARRKKKRLQRRNIRTNKRIFRRPRQTYFGRSQRINSKVPDLLSHLRRQVVVMDRMSVICQDEESQICYEYLSKLPYFIRRYWYFIYEPFMQNRENWFIYFSKALHELDPSLECAYGVCRWRNINRVVSSKINRHFLALTQTKI